MSLGFYVNLQRCIGCKTCQVACKDRQNIQTAGARLRRVESFESGVYPEVGMVHLSLSCNHCDMPAFVGNCPQGAMVKTPDGIVQHIDEKCIVCRTCLTACPYGAPQHDEASDSILKCDSCKALRESGKNPTCVDSCPQRALDFGEMDDFRAKYGSDLVSELPTTPQAGATVPNLLLRATPAALRAESILVQL